MQITTAVDIEDALRTDLTYLYDELGLTGYTITAMPIPEALGELPADGVLICLRRVGGNRTSLVVDTHGVSIDVYTASWNESIQEANQLAGIISMLPHTAGLSVQYHSVDITTLPYELPDTSNPMLKRVRMLTQMNVKAQIETI